MIEVDTIPTAIQQRDEAVAMHAFDLWQASYRALHAKTLPDRAIHVAAVRRSFDAVAAWLSDTVAEEVTSGQGQ